MIMDSAFQNMLKNHVPSLWLHHGGTMVIKQLQWLTAPLLFDNNTWNNTHIANVGSAMSSPEKAAWEIFNSLDVKYVLVVFGGFVGYPSDDINKFLWMVRIGGGVFPHIKEPDYLRDGQYWIDSQATPTMLNCLMYKLSYYRFVETDGKGFDRELGGQKLGRSISNLPLLRRKQAQLLAQKEVEQERETLGTSEIIYRLIMRSSVCNSYNYNQGAFERDHYSCKMQTKPGKRLYGLHL
ncbi:hypothetical protein POPTR_006G163566v4 [Populus trichocarpa]|uniref:Uncharacterized protein n=1 Tax=Populus trichocarpa TaxID=3694 RepID=A0A3N7F3A7_POPTR|nr:hypothetical protein POPTR_006G163566v4 [Populus trichocarpa]